MTILTAENYYEQDEYMSVSAFKKFQKCELDGLEQFNSSSTAMLVGSYVDAYVEGTLDKFKEEHPELYSTTGKNKGELKVDYKQAEEICKYIDNDKVIQQFLSGDKQTIMTGTIAGVPFKIKMDSYAQTKAIVDLKIMRSVTDTSGNYIDFITQWGYDTQLACYQEVVFQNTGLRLPCFIVAVTKETPINSVVIQIPQEILTRALERVKIDIEHYYDVKMKKVEAVGCGVCATCISKRKVTPIISMYDIMGVEN